MSYVSTIPAPVQGRMQRRRPLPHRLAPRARRHRLHAPVRRDHVRRRARVLLEYTYVYIYACLYLSVYLT